LPKIGFARKGAALRLLSFQALGIKVLALISLSLLSTARAEPEAEVRAALEALRKLPFAWETTAHKRTTEIAGESRDTASNSDSATEVQGKSDLRGFLEITIPASKTVPAPVTVYIHAGNAVGSTPLGWLTRAEMREAVGTHRDELLPLDGKPVRLHRAIAVARKAMLVESPLEEVGGLLTDIKSWRDTEGDPVGKLNEKTIERLWSDNRALTAPEIDGTVTFTLRDGVLTEYRFRLEIGYPPRRGQSERRTVMQWSTRITDIGRAAVEPSSAAFEKLEE
jgi:hypothetical protein